MFTARVILFFIAIATADTCSAALPMTGSRMTPMKRSLSPVARTVPSTAPGRLRCGRCPGGGGMGPKAGGGREEDHPQALSS